MLGGGDKGSHPSMVVEPTNRQEPQRATGMTVQSLLAGSIEFCRCIMRVGRAGVPQ